MERSTPVRKPHTSTADLLTWSETPQPDSPASAPRSTRPHQPSDGIRKVVFGGQVTDEEFESLNKRKPCSGYKMKEMTGSGIFAANGENDESEPGSANPTPNSKTGLRMYQQALAGISHISFAEEESISPRKPTTLTEVAKQRELSGTLESEDAKLKKQLSDAKCKELSGHDIFAPPPEILPRPTTVRALALKDNFDMGEPDLHNPAGGSMSSEETAVKTAKKIDNKKFAELSGNDIFKGDVPPGSAEKPLSVAKLREMSGSNIFADGKVESRDYLGGVRKPPGGESSIALV
ncbi:uncharacterized protein LOC111311275 isoform X1 [Durio zibethinus]|uniref:Uncharacterized protein LOC111311275 isoform X1 n=2 Tax=Durio zibethinus TaxID=66656 RepID=A0A6P6AND6_DURZI|nr:uncharacterized protein LOC111311275 isoform X1 [Durio zibethinus]XP_022766385.1 uncharacterized protein LOC111311275 isoform X1 [Durio zibethinus]